jgi:DNA invertase Pin-like site-specific DNA recombinase
MYTFNVQRLVEDCGGVTEVAKATGKSRTQPYRWVKTNSITTDLLAKIVYANPDINLHKYLEEKHNDGRDQAVA